MRRLLLASALALMLLPVSAKADTFQADSYSVIGGQNVTIFSPKFENVTAGEIKLSGPTGDLLVWCLDVLDSINLPYTYTVNTYSPGDIRPGIATMNASQVRQIASLMYLGLTLGGPLADAAVQLAIWKVEYGASFLSNINSGALFNDMTTELNNTTAGGIWDCPSCVLTVLTDAPVNPSQAFGMVTAAPVPGPVVGAGIPGLIGACLTMFGLARRRRNKLQAV